MSTNGSGNAAKRGPSARITGLMPYLGILGFVVNLAIVLVKSVDDWKVTTLELLLFWVVGIQNIIVGSGHLFMPTMTSQSIGWKPSPFQWEVGLADVGYGVLGVMAPQFGRDFWLATIVVFTIFMWGAAGGHVRSMVRDHNFSPGNAGYYFWYDVVMPAVLITLYVWTR